MAGRRRPLVVLPDGRKAVGNKDSGATCLSKRAFVIEDASEACAYLHTRGYICDRISHNELMTNVGTDYLGA
eukprot:1319448-Pyramimonas_sp.AAC.1